MTHYRKSYRGAVTAAVGALPEFTAMTRLSAWAQPVDPEALPCWGVATPSERMQSASKDDVYRITDLAVVAMRQGGDDLEELLDDWSALIEAAALPALRAVAGVLDAQVVQIDTPLSGEGKKRTGTLAVTFRVTRMTEFADPA